MTTTRRLFLGMVACLPLAWQVKLGAASTPQPMGLAALIRSMPKGTVIAHREVVSYPFWRQMSTEQQVAYVTECERTTGKVIEYAVNTSDGPR